MTKKEMVRSIVNECAYKHNLYYIERTRKEHIEKVYKSWIKKEISNRKAKKMIIETIHNRKKYYQKGLILWKTYLNYLDNAKRWKN